jgi:hypothetical protein
LRRVDHNGRHATERRKGRDIDSVVVPGVAGASADTISTFDRGGRRTTPNARSRLPRRALVPNRADHRSATSGRERRHLLHGTPADVSPVRRPRQPWFSSSLT